MNSLTLCLLLLFGVQPVKITDPHLVSSFFDDYRRVYLHSTVELENKSSWIAECTLILQVTTELEKDVLLVENVQTEELSIPPGATKQHTLLPVSVPTFLKPSFSDH